MSVKMNQELDQVRTTNREIYERELKSLRESRDMLMTHLNVSEKRKMELEERLHKITLEYEKVKNNEGSGISEIKSSLQLKTFECDRLKQSLAETMSALKSAQHEKEGLAKKLEFLGKENGQLQLDMKQNMASLQTEKDQLKSQIGLYEEMEKLMDEFISSQGKLFHPLINNNTFIVHHMYIASSDDDGQKWFTSVISNLPVSTQRRMKQSISLCKALREREQQNKVLHEENESLKQREHDLLEDIKLYDAIINQKGEETRLVDQIKHFHKDLQKEKKDKNMVEKRFQ